MIPPDRPYSFDARVDARMNYRTQSILVVPLQDPPANILGVLELINAMDRGQIVPFDSRFESLVRALASQAAVAIRNARLEDQSLKDALTDVYNRRYFMIRLEEEVKRHSRFGEPLSLVMLDVDHFKEINDRFGHRAGDETLRGIAELLLKHSRSFSVVTRYGGDEFAIVLVKTPKAGALTYADRMRSGRKPEPMPLSEPSLAGHVAQTGEILNVRDPYTIGGQRRVAFNKTVEETNDYATRSVFAVPLQDRNGSIVGVLELLNALGEDGATVPFDPEYEKLIRALASQAAIAIRNARLEDLSVKDALTDLFNRRYFALRLDEEAKRGARFGHPLSLVYIDLDDFQKLNEGKGRPAGDEVLKEVARLLVKHSRSFTIVARRQDDDFAAILANTPKAGAMSYAERIRGVIEQHPFPQGPVTATLGVAAFPADAATAEALMAQAEHALNEAKARGCKRAGEL